MGKKMRGFIIRLSYLIKYFSGRKKYFIVKVVKK